mgnify:CR=1 FL=1
MAVPLGNFVSTTTRQRFFEKSVDQAYTGNVLFNRLRSTSRPWTGGRQITQPLIVSNRTQAGSFSSFDTLPTAQEDVRQMASVDPCEYTSDPITFSGIQLAVNKGPEAFLNAMATEFTDVARNLSENIGADLYLDGTGNASKDINGLVYHVDDATNVVTWQGLSRTTYANLRSTLTAQSGALGFDDLATDTDAAQRGSDSATDIFTTPAVFSIIERLVTPTLYINYNGPSSGNVPAGERAGNSLNYGATSISWRGIPIYSDEMATSGNIYTLNLKHLFLYQLDYTPEIAEMVKEGFAFTGFKKSQNQAAVTGQLLFAGQLWGDAPRTHARRTAVTS